MWSQFESYLISCCCGLNKQSWVVPKLCFHGLGHGFSLMPPLGGNICCYYAFNILEPWKLIDFLWWSYWCPWSSLNIWHVMELPSWIAWMLPIRVVCFQCRVFPGDVPSCWGAWLAVSCHLILHALIINVVTLSYDIYSICHL